MVGSSFDDDQDSEEDDNDKQCHLDKDARDADPARQCVRRNDEARAPSPSPSPAWEAPCHVTENEKTGEHIICATSYSDEEGSMCPASEKARCTMGIHCFVATRGRKGAFTCSNPRSLHDVIDG